MVQPAHILRIWRISFKKSLNLHTCTVREWVLVHFEKELLSGCTAVPPSPCLSLDGLPCFLVGNSAVEELSTPWFVKAEYRPNGCSVVSPASRQWRQLCPRIARSHIWCQSQQLKHLGFQNHQHRLRCKRLSPKRKKKVNFVSKIPPA